MRLRPLVALLLCALTLPAIAAEPAQAARAKAEQWLRDQYAASGGRVVAQAAALDPHLNLAPCTAPLSGGLQEKLLAVAAAKFDAVEIFENDLLFFDGTARDVRRLADELGLKIALFQPFRDFEAVPDAQFRRNLDRAERKFDLMGELGAKMMLVCSSVSPLALDDDDLAAAQLHELAERAAGRGIWRGTRTGRSLT